MLVKTAKEPILYGVALAAILVTAWFVYQPAFGSVFLLDDRPNLDRLTTVTDMDSALQFVLSGNAGPVGRPLSLATFAAQAELWDYSAAPFILVNVVIHLLNGLLTYCFFLQLTRARQIRRPDDQYVALAAAALWLFLPLLASSSLMVIQRMTTLSAMFILLGLNAYLYARSFLGTRPKAALTTMSAALVTATLLATLSKENGALLPSLVLAMEVTVLARPGSLGIGTWRIWQSVFLLAPTVFILCYLLTCTDYGDLLILQKEYTAWERLLTEARVLWEYLFNAFVARPNQLGPFHDDYPLAESLLEPLTLLAVAGWLLVAVGAIVWRRKYPAAAFAALWFLVGHSLESTTIPLYLYFEHRNYIPLLGPAYALCCLMLIKSMNHRRIVRAAMALYIVVNASILYSVTSLWGNPSVAANYWHWNAPGSTGATGHLALQRASTMGASVAMLTLREIAQTHPRHAHMRLPELTLSCHAYPERDQSDIVNDLKEKLPAVRFSYSVGSMLDELMNTVKHSACNGVDSTTVKELALAVLRNPSYGSDAEYKGIHYRLLAGIAWNSGDRGLAWAHMMTARSYTRNPQLNVMFVTVLAASKEFDAARRYIAEAHEKLPGHPFRRIAERISLRDLTRFVDELEVRSGTNTESAAKAEE